MSKAPLQIVLLSVRPFLALENFAPFTGCLNIVCFPRIIESFPPLPRQHSAVIGCTKNYQLIGVIVHSQCVESFEGLFSYVTEGGVAVNCEKIQILVNTL